MNPHHSSIARTLCLATALLCTAPFGHAHNVWLEADAEVWAVVVKPWVLVQDRA